MQLPVFFVGGVEGDCGSGGFYHYSIAANIAANL